MASVFVTLPKQSISVGSVQITDGVDTLAVNADGSINVALSGGGITTATYDEVLAVASGSPTIVTTFTAVGSTKLKSVQASGTNIAMYEVKINGTVYAKGYTNFGSNLSHSFSFGDGIALILSDVVDIVVTHNRTSAGDFNATIITQG